MVAMRRRRMVIVTAGLWVLAVAALAEPNPRDLEIRDLLRDAIASFERNEYGEALGLARRVKAAIDQLKGERPLAPEERRLCAEAIFMAGESEQNPREADLEDALRAALREDPGFEPAQSRYGRRAVDRWRRIRGELVGDVVLRCRIGAAPVPCGRARVAGLDHDVPDSGNLPLLAGTYTIEILRSNCDPVTKDGVEVVPGTRTAELDIELRRTSRDVVVVTQPPGVRVSVDDVAVGETEPGPSDQTTGALALGSLKVGKHKLALQRSCFRPQGGTIEIAPGEGGEPDEVRLPYTLRESKAQVTVESIILEAELSLDGKRAVLNRKNEVCPGSVLAEVRLPGPGGRLIWTRRINVAEGEDRSETVIPRVSVALFNMSPGAPITGFPDETWNLVGLPEPARPRLDEALKKCLAAEGESFWPLVERYELDAELLSGFTEVDLVVAVVRNDKSPQPRLASVEPHSRLLECTSFNVLADRETLAKALSPAPQVFESFSGFDLASRPDAPPIVAYVVPGGPADKAGLSAGTVVLRIESIESPTVRQLDELLLKRSTDSDAPLKVSIVGPNGSPDVREVYVTRTVSTRSLPGSDQGLIGPILARLALPGLLGDQKDAAAAAALMGLYLASTGKADVLVGRLLETTVGSDLDPAGDAEATCRWTYGWVLTRSNPGYRRPSLDSRDGARIGGRRGPAARYDAYRVP